MESYLSLLDKYIFSNVIGSLTWDLLKSGWEKVTRKPWEELYIISFSKSLEALRPYFSKYGNGYIELDKKALKNALRQNSKINISKKGLSEISSEEYSKQLGNELAKSQAIIIGGHTLNDDDYENLIHHLVGHTKMVFKETIIANEEAFREAVLTEELSNNTTMKEVQLFLKNNFSLVLDRLDELKQKADKQEPENNTQERQIKTLKLIGQNTNSPEDVSGEFYIRLRKVLLTCKGPLETDRHLKALFAHPELKPWQQRLPDANNLIERVDLLVDYLANERHKTGKPVLATFLGILSVRFEGTNCYNLLIDLINEIEKNN